MKLGALPTINLPERSHETAKPTGRRHINIVKDVSQKKCDAYKTYNEFEKSVSMLKLNGWLPMKVNTNYHFKTFQPLYSQPHIEVTVGRELEFKVLGFGWSLPTDSPIYEKYKRSLRNIRISALLSEVINMQLCEGLGVKVVRSVDHFLQQDVDPALADGCQPKQKIYHRSRDCTVFIQGEFLLIQ